MKRTKEIKRFIRHAAIRAVRLDRKEGIITEEKNILSWYKLYRDEYLSQIRENDYSGVVSWIHNMNSDIKIPTALQDQIVIWDLN